MSRIHKLHLLIRVRGAAGKLPYQEVAPTVYFGCGWGEGAKDKTPFGGLPILEVDGKVFHPPAAAGLLLVRAAMPNFCGVPH